jgi:hypothetical protein
MTTQKYFYKGRDFLELRKITGRLAIAFALTIGLLLFAVILPAFALDWNDNEWANCPRAVEGTWISENPNSLKSKMLSIQENKISMINYYDGEVSFTGNTFAKKGKFIEAVLQSTAKDKEIHLKLRPHLVQTNSGPENKTYCSIKVFKFNSQAHAKLDKYSSWDIYQLNRN